MRLCFNYKLTGMTSTRGFNLLCTFQVSVRCVRTEINGSYQCKFMAKLKPRPMNTGMPTRISLRFSMPKKMEFFFALPSPSSAQKSARTSLCLKSAQECEDCVALFRRQDQQDQKQICAVLGQISCPCADRTLYPAWSDMCKAARVAVSRLKIEQRLNEAKGYCHSAQCMFMAPAQSRDSWNLVHHELIYALLHSSIDPKIRGTTPRIEINKSFLLHHFYLRLASTLFIEKHFFL